MSTSQLPLPSFAQPTSRVHLYKRFSLAVLILLLVAVAIASWQHLAIKQSEERAIDSVSRSMAALSQVTVSPAEPVEFTDIARYVTGLRTADASATLRTGDDQSVYVRSTPAAVTICAASHGGRSFCSRYDLKTKLVSHTAGDDEQQLIHVGFLAVNHDWNGWNL